MPFDKVKVLKLIEDARKLSVSEEASAYNFVADWTQLYPVLNIMSYLKGHDLSVYAPGFLSKRRIRLIKSLPRGTPDAIGEISESVSLVVKENSKRFFDSSNYKRIWFDSSIWSTKDGRVRIIYKGDTFFKEFDRYRILSLGVLRLVNLIDDMKIRKEILYITTYYNDVVIDIKIQERTFVFIEVENK